MLVFATAFGIDLYGVCHCSIGVEQVLCVLSAVVGRSVNECRLLFVLKVGAVIHALLGMLDLFLADN